MICLSQLKINCWGGKYFVSQVFYERISAFRMYRQNVSIITKCRLKQNRQFSTMATFTVYITKAVKTKLSFWSCTTVAIQSKSILSLLEQLFNYFACLLSQLVNSNLEDLNSKLTQMTKKTKMTKSLIKTNFVLFFIANRRISTTSVNIVKTAVIFTPLNQKTRV